MSSTTAKPGKVLSPSKLAHVVLRTNNLARLRQYYINFLGADVVVENEYATFLTYDDEHHRIAIAQLDHLSENTMNTNGMEHIAFTFDTLSDLCTAYKQRKALGITPGWCVNHGPTTSMYYQDPDGNRIETQVDNFDNPADATAFMTSPAWRENSLGTDFDPEELCRRVESGEDDRSIKTQKSSGPRGTVGDLMVVMQKMSESQHGM